MPGTLPQPSDAYDRAMRTEYDVADPDVNREGSDVRDANKKRREAVTLDYIFDQASAVFAPYKVAVKKGTTPDWWAAYQIGQRMSDKFSSRTPDGIDRVFIVGDGKSDTNFGNIRFES